MEPTLNRLGALAERHCAERGWHVADVRRERSDLTYVVEVPGRGAVRFRTDGEVFTLSFPGGYSWTEFAYQDDEREDALTDQLRFLDAYADARTQEVTVSRRVRRDRRELRVSNGAVLRARGWSHGPVTST